MKYQDICTNVSTLWYDFSPIKMPKDISLIMILLYHDQRGKRWKAGRNWLKTIGYSLWKETEVLMSFILPEALISFHVPLANKTWPIPTFLSFWAHNSPCTPTLRNCQMAFVSYLHTLFLKSNRLVCIAVSISVHFCFSTTLIQTHRGSSSWSLAVLRSSRHA